MWLFTRYGFFSISVQRQDGAPVALIRARSRDHLMRLQTRFPEHLGGKVLFETLEADYPYRFAVPQDTWTTIATQLAGEQSWSNFKGECERVFGGGNAYVDLLHDLWSSARRSLDPRAKRPR